MSNPAIRYILTTADSIKDAKDNRGYDMELSEDDLAEALATALSYECIVCIEKMWVIE